MAIRSVHSIARLINLSCVDVSGGCCCCWDEEAEVEGVGVRDEKRDEAEDELGVRVGDEDDGQVSRSRSRWRRGGRAGLVRVGSGGVEE